MPQPTTAARTATRLEAADAARQETAELRGRGRAHALQEASGKKRTKETN